MPIYASKKTHTPFTNPYKCRFQTPIYDAKKTPIFEKKHEFFNLCKRTPMSPKPMPFNPNRHGL